MKWSRTRCPHHKSTELIQSILLQQAAQILLRIFAATEKLFPPGRLHTWEFQHCVSQHWDFNMLMNDLQIPLSSLQRRTSHGGCRDIIFLGNLSLPPKIQTLSWLQMHRASAEEHTGTRWQYPVTGPNKRKHSTSMCSSWKRHNMPCSTGWDNWGSSQSLLHQTIQLQCPTSPSKAGHGHHRCANWPHSYCSCVGTTAYYCGCVTFRGGWMSLPMSCHVQPRCQEQSCPYIFAFSRPSHGNGKSPYWISFLRVGTTSFPFSCSSFQNPTAMGVDALSVSWRSILQKSLTLFIFYFPRSIYLSCQI